MGLYKTSIFSIFTFIWANDLKFCTRSHTSCRYCMMGLKFAKWWRHTLELYCRPSGTENSQLTTLSVLSVLGETSISLCGTRHSCPRPHGWFWSFRRFPRARNRRFVLVVFSLFSRLFSFVWLWRSWFELLNSSLLLIPLLNGGLFKYRSMAFLKLQSDDREYSWPSFVLASA